MGPVQGVTWKGGSRKGGKGRGRLHEHIRQVRKEGGRMGGSEREREGGRRAGVADPDLVTMQYHDQRFHSPISLPNSAKECVCLKFVFFFWSC